MAPRRDSLARYRQKRDFTRTPEPPPLHKARPGRRYLIQKHAATRLHYDFRLELDGVLKSWAVTKGPSFDPHDRRLAVEVEDHPVAYGFFEGIIPKGQYGGGTVMLWDEGSWEPIGDPREGLKKGKLEFILRGKRLKGEWTLVRMRPREGDKGRNNWLLIKHRDAEAHEGEGDRLLARNATSIASGRTMEKIAAAEDRVWQSKAESSSRLPAFIPPQLATLTDAMPQGKHWVHEIKFDGYRALAYVEKGKARIFTRTGQNWTHKFSEIAAALGPLSGSAILDGEIVALDDKGASSFKALQQALSEGRSEGLHYYVFDLLRLDGDDLTRLPLLKRKARLKKLLKGKRLGGRVFYSEHFARQNDTFLERLCGLGMEGVVSKRADAPYASGRGKAWLKTRCHKRQEFVIGGFTFPAHGERGIGALLLGYYDHGRLMYAGKVGTGFGHDASLFLRRRLDRLAQDTMPFDAVPADGRHGARWVKPELVCEVEFTEWTGDGRLRHPSYQGLREDKPAQAVGRDDPVQPGSMKPPGASSIKKSSRKEEAMVGGIRISHPDRLIYPDTNITKLKLAEYYSSVAERILPHVRNRPLSTIRCPEGSGEPCFFQRHVGRGQSEHIHDAPVKVKNRTETYMRIEDKAGLISLVQWGVIELHPWGCLADRPEHPDRIIFDLDPDPAVAWKDMIEAACEIRARMREFGLESFLKTTGGKGLHVTVPIIRRYDWPTVKAFARAVALSMQHDRPALYIATASKVARKGRIFVDYLRNELTATAVAPFSARAREGATVAMPLLWEELQPSLSPARFTIETVPAFLQKRKQDPWAGFFSLRQNIRGAHLRALGIPSE